MDEQLRIIKMVEEGKLNAEQAAALLEALKSSSGTESTGRTTKNPIPDFFEHLKPKPTPTSSYEKKMFHIQIKAADFNPLNLQFPVSGIKGLLQATGKIPILCEDVGGISLKEFTGLDLKQTIDLIVKRMDNEATGDFINITKPDGSIFRIYVE